MVWTADRWGKKFFSGAYEIEAASPPSENNFVEMRAKELPRPAFYIRGLLFKVHWLYVFAL